MTEITYLVLSDIHLGHRKNPTADIIRNLDVYFDQYRSTSQFTSLDLIFIAGDLFDGLLDLGCIQYHQIKAWAHRLMGFCGRHNIRLRVLEGTPSHDWHQSKMMETLHQITAIQTALDFRYIDTLYIEQIKDLDLSILYVPDEFHPDSAVTFQQVQHTVSEAGLSRVDICIMHGAFGYQLRQAPAHIQRHLETDYLGIVEYWISIGHVHVHSFYERIIPQGSFDRLSHGEEHPKGGVVLSIRGPDGPKWDFIENVGAKIFKTIEVRGTDLDRSMAQIRKACVKLPDESHVRIKASKSHPCYMGLKEIQLEYVMLHFTKSNTDDDDVPRTTLVDLISSDVYTPVSITSGNIVDLLMEAMTDLNDSQLALARCILEETV